MGIECEQLGKTVIYRRNGTKFELDHETTVKICEEMNCEIFIGCQDIV